MKVALLCLAVLLVVNVSIGARNPDQRRARKMRRILRRMVNGMFPAADANKDGSLDQTEFWNTYSRIDADKNNAVTQTEYTNYMKGIRMLRRFMTQEQVVQRSAAIFQKGDANGDGTLTQDEGNIIFGKLDANNDGKVTKAEYISRWANVFRG